MKCCDAKLLSEHSFVHCTFIACSKRAEGNYWSSQDPPTARPGQYESTCVTFTRFVSCRHRLPVPQDRSESSKCEGKVTAAWQESANEDQVYCSITFI